MIHAAIIVLGLFAAAAVLTLGRIEHTVAGGQGTTGLPDPFGAALSHIVAWISFAGTLTACLYTLGLVAALVLGGGSLTLGRLAPPSPAFEPAFRLKLPLAFAALILAILALLGVMNLIEGAFENG